MAYTKFTAFVDTTESHNRGTSSSLHEAWANLATANGWLESDSFILSLFQKVRTLYLCEMNGSQMKISCNDLFFLLFQLTYPTCLTN